MQNILPAIPFSLSFMSLFHLTFWKGVYSLWVLLMFSATGESYHRFDLLIKKPHTGVSMLFLSGPPRESKIKFHVLEVNKCLKVLKRFYLCVHILDSMCPFIMRSHKTYHALTCWQQKI